MADKPATLEDALAALARLEKVVDRLSERINEIEDVKVPMIRRDVDRALDTSDWLLDRSDEVGAAAIKSGRDLGQRINADVPANASPAQRLAPRVTRVRIGNRTVARRA